MVLLISFALSICISVLWIVRRHKVRNREKSESLKKGSYSAGQIFGIICIILFLIPIFLVVFSNLIKGIMILILMLFQFVKLPEQINSLAVSIILPCLYSLMFLTIYILSVFIWPKKKEMKV
jgi:ABC-type Fe3+ transport system permease subunit